MNTTLIVRLLSELLSLAHLKGTFDPKKHPTLLKLLGGGYRGHARQTHAEYLLAEHIDRCRGTFAFHTGFVPSVEQLQEALLILFFDPEKRSILDRHEDIIINVFEMEVILPNGESERRLGWSRETFKRKQLPLMLRYLARHLALQPMPLLSEAAVDKVLAELDFMLGGEADDDDAA